MTTRLVSFGLSALVLVLVSSRASEYGRVAGGLPKPASQTDAKDIAWIVAIALVASCASFLAPDFDQKAGRPWTYMLLTRLVPMLCVFGAGVLAAIFLPDAGIQRGLRRWVHWIAIAVIPPLLYSSLHYGLSVDSGSGIGSVQIDRLVVLTLAGPVFIILVCVFWALHRRIEEGLGPSDGPVRGLGPGWIFASGGAGLLLAMAGYFGWMMITADIHAHRAERSFQRGDHVLAEAQYGRAVQLLPYERQYQREWMAMPLVAAIREINKGAPGSYPAIARHLSLSEDRARSNLARWPSDPWSVFSLAGILRLRALPAMRAHDPQSGDRAVADARALFLRAHQMFPNQPVFLRDWARFEAEDGGFADAAQMLERMEAIIPNEIEPYVERILLAKRRDSGAEIAATLERAKKQLTLVDYQKIEAVAKMQR